jgi:hypothetical protein
VRLIFPQSKKAADCNVTVKAEMLNTACAPRTARGAGGRGSRPDCQGSLCGGWGVRFVGKSTSGPDGGIPATPLRGQANAGTMSHTVETVEKV